ncbi:MAG: hypothetical protein NE327_16030 [Lentisphaeraceae bacterium]|nr:hypothetical protein [Lentisphaeraceae bacterium]
MFNKFLKLSDTLRPNYSKSLDVSGLTPLKSLKLKGINLPDFIKNIYTQVKGTIYELDDQKLMDFIPGYRLIHIDEYEEDYRTVTNMIGDNTYLPFLGNYSNDYICWKEGKIYSIFHDDPAIYLVHENEEKFYETRCAFYEQSIYFLDENGFLDYDFEKHKLLGLDINSNIPYWLEN